MCRSLGAGRLIMVLRGCRRGGAWAAVALAAAVAVCGVTGSSATCSPHSNATQCSGNGLCMDHDADGKFHCFCVPGFIGPDCSQSAWAPRRRRPERPLTREDGARRDVPDALQRARELRRGEADVRVREGVDGQRLQQV